MRVTYRVYNDWSLSQKNTLKSYGLDVEEGYGRIDIVDDESNREIIKIIEEWGIQVFYWTDYEKKDYQKSSILMYAGTWANGYPMPDGDGGYLTLTYNTEDYCQACGIGKIQKEPFRLKKEPRWNGKMLFELNWIYDEIFVKKELYESLFKKLNTECWPVVLYKKEVEIENTVQLKIPIIDIPLLLENQPFEICQTCGRKKYSPQVKGFFPGFAQNLPALGIFKCREYFGSGAEAHNKIFITKELWDDLKALNIKPNLWPVEQVA